MVGVRLVLIVVVVAVVVVVFAVFADFRFSLGTEESILDFCFVLGRMHFYFSGFSICLYCHVDSQSDYAHPCNTRIKGFCNYHQH